MASIFEKMEENIYDVIVIGGGPAGASAAIYASRAKLRTLVLDKSMTAGALGMTHKIANYPGVPEELSGSELLQRMHDQATSFGAELIKTKVQGVRLDEEGHKAVFTNTGDVYKSKSLILSTGGMGKNKSIPGEDELLGKGVSYCATCDAAFYRDAVTAVAGSSDEAVEEALVLTRFAKTVHLLNPKKSFDIDAALLDEAENAENLVIHYGKRIESVMGDFSVKSIRFRSGEELEVDGVFLYLAGTKPIIDYLAGALGTTEDSCLIVDNNFETSVPGVFAVGDMLCREIKQVVVAASEGAIAALNADKYIRGRKKVKADYN